MSKTTITAEPNKQELFITREFAAPRELVYKAHIEPEIVAKWMGTKVLQLEAKKHGNFQLETTDPQGNVHRFNGTIHNLVPNEKITRTFEMENTSFPTQLEFFEFEKLTDKTSKLTMHIIYKSVEVRDAILKLPFEFGLNKAHDKLQETINQLK
ncbi:SRPBCC domain-containing protein [Flavobacterium sp.]|uniref:SRPBCC domain-containing protein n=1 Tax=Flavobacterium sp. TaxID=239 RepID=UPI003C704B21